MSVSFFKHKKALIDAYKDVLDDSTGTDWALFTYEGKENELKVVDTGEDGLEELESEFNSGKIMYSFIRVKDPKTSLIKFIFLHWQGEGAPANRKGACANHVNDVTRFFKGAHITINARNEDDVTPEQIMQHVSRASASTYTFDKKQGFGNDEPAGAVGSVYKRTNAHAEISSTRNESYWAKQEREEEQRKKEEERKKVEERRKYTQQLKESEKESSQRRSEWEKARENEISEKMRAAKLADDNSEVRKKEKENWEVEQREMELESGRGRKRSESIEKAAEAAYLVQSRDNNPRTMWEKKIHDAGKPQFHPETRISVGGNSGEKSIPENVEEDYQEMIREDEINNQPEASYEPEEPTYDEPTQPTYDEPAPAQEVENQSSSDNHYNAVDTQSQQAEDNFAEGGETEYQARTLYDYQAVDDSEISFDPDDIITNITMVDEGWWRGYAPDGTYGLFPANYVELL